MTHLVHGLIRASVTLVTLALSAGVGFECAAQRAIIVDSANGPGTDFTALDDAMTASRPGDRILVRVGTGVPYLWLRSPGHGVTLCSEGADPPLVTPALQIFGLRASQMFVIDNIRFVAPTWGRSVTFEGCDGTVLLSRLRQDDATRSGVGAAVGNRRVIFTDCHFEYQSSGLMALGSNFYVLDSVSRASFAGQEPRIGLLYGAGLLVQGWSLRTSSAWIVNSELVGGDNAPVAGGFALAGLYVEQGIDEPRQNNAIVAGRTTCRGGMESFPPGQVPGIQTWSGLIGTFLHDMIGIDPLVNTVGPRSTAGYEVIREFATVSPGDAVRGQPQAIELIGPSDAVLALFVSLLTPRGPLPTDWGDLWLDPATTFLVGAGAVDANRDLNLTMPVPSILGRGDVLVYQSAALSPHQGFELSIPGFAVVQ